MTPERLKQLPGEELDSRISRTIQLLEERDANAAVLFYSTSIEYLTGFKAT